IIVRAFVKPLAHLLFEFGKKTNKHLPEKYLVNNKNYLNGLRDGLIDSDGYLDNGIRCFTNTSICLVELYSLVTYLLDGYFPSVTIKKISTGKLSNINLDNCNNSFRVKEYIK